MKRVILLGLFACVCAAVAAQNCDSIVLPYFGGDVAKMEQYKALAPEKYEYRCLYATSAFDESDTVPAGADVFPISSVQSLSTNEYLNSDYVVDLYTLSYYAYNFKSFQNSYANGDKVLCFSTPSSTHPYLVLNSLNTMLRVANEWWEREVGGRQE